MATEMLLRLVRCAFSGGVELGDVFPEDLPGLLVDAGAQMDQEMKLHAIEMKRVNEAQQARGGFYCSSCELVSSLPSPILTTSNGVFPCQAAVEAQFEAAAQLEARKSKKGSTPTRQPKVGSDQNEETKSSVCAVQ